MRLPARALGQLVGMDATIPDWRDKFSGYSGNACEIGGRASSEMGGLLERTLLSINQDVLEWVDEVLKSSSIPQSEAIASDANAAMANTKTGFDGILKAVRRTAGYADASVRVAAAATAQAVNSTAK